MSIFKLKNKTGLESYQEWCDYTFPNDVAVDLLDTPELKLGLSDIVGIENGYTFENIANLIRTNKWCLNDGDVDLSKDDSLFMLKYNKSPLIKTCSYLGNSSVAFESHNIANVNEWTDGDSKFVIAPLAGRELLLHGSKIIIDRNLIVDDTMYFRIYTGSYLVNEISYNSLIKLLLGSVSSYVTPQVGDILTTGSPELLHIIYKYDEPIPLKSSLAMRLEIGFKDNKPPKRADSILMIRLTATSVKEV